MKFRCVAFSLALVFLLGGALAVSARNLEMKALSGKWTCPTCDAKRLQGNQTECEDQGHQHVLKLNDGTMVTFVPSDRASDLIHGGGRHSCPIKIYGFYNEKLSTLDVEAYEIDGQWSSWCEAHGQMDHCRADGVPEPAGSAAVSAR